MPKLKKVVRVKNQQPMILTDTPSTTFDKVSLDVVGAPDNWKRRLVCTHDTRFAYEIFNDSQANVIRNSWRTHRKVYQSLYRAESIDYRSGPEFYK